VMLMAFKSAAQTALVPYGSAWKYLDNGSDQGVAWQATTFDDSAWKSGNGKFGYGNNNEATIISYGPDPSNTYITTYFRKTISISNVSAFTSFTGNIKRDDGAVVYVNGVEVFRSSMPAGTIAYNTVAMYAQDNGTEPQTFTIPGSAFTSGNNVIAVEIHQVSNTSSDMSFDLELIGTADQPAPVAQGIFPFGSTWKYLDNGSDQGRAWQASSFDDGGWKTGNGKFGYGYGDEATLISYGPDPYNKYTTTYFRKALTLADASAFTSFTGNVKRDDGVVVYVNGVEVYRNNLPAGTITYTTRASSASDNGQTAIPFTINASAFVSGTNVIAVEVHQTNLYSFDMGFDLELIGNAGTAPADQTPPTVLSLNRQSPTEETTGATSVVFRATFSEAVTGVDASDFALALSGSATGTLASAVPAGTGGTSYDLTVNGISGSGTLGLNLNGTGTGIVDAAGNPIGGGFTGQTYTIQQPAPGTYGFASAINLNAILSRVDATKGRPQAKVFTNAGRHWAIIAATGGTFLWRLDGTSWSNILRLSNRNARADCIVDGNVTHIFLFTGKGSELVSVEYDPNTITYVPWTKRKVKVDLALDDGVETGTIALDGTGRLWLASDAYTDINVRYSDAPYTSWSGPVTIGAGVSTDDISAVIYMPALGKIGVLWSNQTTQRFGFKTHSDGQDPATWSADEVPASQSALIEGKGMADDHLDMKVTSDGTLYCAVKTGYDEPGYPNIALLVRRPAGTWDNLYGVSEYGTAPIVLVNEAIGKVKVVYTSQTYGGDILYKELPMSGISFGRELTLISGVYNYATASHQLYASEVVVLAGNSEHVGGVLASDVPPTSPAARLAQAAPAETQQQIQAYPNPFTSEAKIRFTLPRDGWYTLTLYDSKMGQVFQKQGTARAGKQNIIEIAGSGLGRGLYYARLQTNDNTRTLKLVVDK
jgi:hypothetical protein